MRAPARPPSRSGQDAVGAIGLAAARALRTVLASPPLRLLCSRCRSWTAERAGHRKRCAKGPRAGEESTRAWIGIDGLVRHTPPSVDKPLRAARQRAHAQSGRAGQGRRRAGDATCVRPRLGGSSTCWSAPENRAEAFGVSRRSTRTRSAEDAINRPRAMGPVLRRLATRLQPRVCYPTDRKHQRRRAEKSVPN